MSYFNMTNIICIHVANVINSNCWVSGPAARNMLCEKDRYYMAVIIWLLYGFHKLFKACTQRHNGLFSSGLLAFSKLLKLFQIESRISNNLLKHKQGRKI